MWVVMPDSTDYVAGHVEKRRLFLDHSCLIKSDNERKYSCDLFILLRHCLLSEVHVRKTKLSYVLIRKRKSVDTFAYDYCS